MYSLNSIKSAVYWYQRNLATKKELKGMIEHADDEAIVWLLQQGYIKKVRNGYALTL